MRLLIVGGGPAALATARGYREAGGDGEVTLLTPELSVPYDRPPLSKAFLRGDEDPDLAMEPPAWYAEHGVEVRLNAEVETLDPAAHTVLLGSGEALRYDACVLATGSEPKPLPVPGATGENVLTLRSLASARVLRDRARAAEHAVVIGSGFIGCEAAASLAMRGLKVTLVSSEDIPHASRLGEDAGARITGWLEAHGVHLRLGNAVEEITETAVRVAGSDAPIAADLILMASGMRPCAGLAETAGLTLHEGRIAVDAAMRTSAPDVLAAGDVVYAANAKAGRPLAVEHWGEALNMGKVAGATAAGAQAEWDVAPGFWSTIGEHTLKYVAWGDGYDEARLDDHGGGAFTVWYGQEGTTVGVLTHERDEDYERGRELVEQGAALP
jgi:3-phenylpropionate/trans-cinnamate dioxygenase ferredoxin reductase component